jgi:hypothetical protein
MPLGEGALGFSNPWFPEAFESAVERHGIKVASPARLVATKLAAWKSRGQGDLVRSRDTHDVFVLMDGSSELSGDLDGSSPELQAFLRHELRGLLAHPGIDDAILGAMAPYGGELAERAAERVRRRTIEISALASAGSDSPPPPL